MEAEPKWHQLLHRNVFVRFMMPIIIGLAMLTLVVIDVVHGAMSITLLPWIIPGIIVGYPFGHMTKLDWKDGKLNATRDRTQWIILLVYVAVRFGERSAVSSFFGDQPYAGDIILLLTSGMLIGRSLGLIWPVRAALNRGS